MKRQSGFTLLEVLMALTIFTIIGIATVKHISQIQLTKDIAFADLENYNSLRSAISMMRFDLSQSFHVQYDQLGGEARALVAQGQKAHHTVFDGRKSEIVFTSLSHRNYYTGRRESEQTEISYFLQKREGSKFPTLMKREAELIDDDQYTGGSIYSLVDNVETMEMKYWDDKEGKWIDEWNSDAGNHRDRFPMGVKIKITVRAAKEGAPLTAETIFKIAFNNNEPILVQF